MIKNYGLRDSDSKDQLYRRTASDDPTATRATKRAAEVGCSVLINLDCTGVGDLELGVEC